MQLMSLYIEYICKKVTRTSNTKLKKKSSKSHYIKKYHVFCPSQSPWLHRPCTLYLENVSGATSVL